MSLLLRTLLNQMLSNVCILNIWFTLVNISTFLLVFSFNSLPNQLCELIVSHARLIFICSLLQLTIRQLVKYVYIVLWKYMSIIDDEFVALFLLQWGMMICSIFIYISYFFGHNNNEMNYHYCTGNKHSMNIQNTLAYLQTHGNINFRQIWIKNLLGQDPLDYLTFSLLALLVVVSIFTWINKHSKKLEYIFKNIYPKKKSTQTGNVGDIALVTQTSTQGQSKLFDLEAGQIIASIIIGTICIYPSVMVKRIVNENENNLNSGAGRVWVYISQICLVFFFFNVFPAQIILSNPRMMKSILREFKGSIIGKRIWKNS